MKEGQKELKSGYTTGVHAAAALYSAVCEYLGLPSCDTVAVLLPDGRKPLIEAHGGISVKGDNDDIDATKGCKIRVTVKDSFDAFTGSFVKAHIRSLRLHRGYPKAKALTLRLQNRSLHMRLYKADIISHISHSPYVLDFGAYKCYVYAGDGVGVVTKKGLKPPVGYPAINPVPLSMFQNVLSSFTEFAVCDLHICISVENGEEIAKQTANAKVGVMGGISILGTTGIVKPISNEAMLSSIEAEISVIANSSDEIVFTIGNTAYKLGVESYGEEVCVEIGNFVYDTLQMLSGKSFKRLTLITGQGKCAKIGQGFANTHNRFGDTDFLQVAKWLKDYGIECDISECGTIKGVVECLGEPLSDRFFEILKEKARGRICEFLPEDSKGVEICICISGG